MTALPTSLWLRLAAVSGASAVALGAYGAHGLRPADPKFLDTFDRGNKYHLVHSLLLAATPSARCVSRDGARVAVSQMMLRGLNIAPLRRHGCMFD